MIRLCDPVGHVWHAWGPVYVTRAVPEVKSLSVQSPSDYYLRRCTRCGTRAWFHSPKWTVWTPYPDGPDLVAGWLVGEAPDGE